MQRMNVYKDWVLEKVLRIDSETALVILPIMDAEPNYRDTDPGCDAFSNTQPRWC